MIRHKISRSKLPLMFAILSVGVGVCGGFTVRAESSYRLKFIATLEPADEAETKFVGRMANSVYVMLGHWSWARENLRGDWKIRFANLSSLPGLPPDADAAFDVGPDGQRRIILAWDRLRDRIDYPTLLVFEHIVAILYRVSILGPDSAGDSQAANQLHMDAVYRAWSDWRQTDIYRGLAPNVREAVDTRFRTNQAAAFPGLTDEQIQQIGCDHLLRGKPQ